MAAPLRVLCVVALFITCTATAQPQDAEDLKLELFDGVYVNFPKENSTDEVMSFELDLKKTIGEGRSKQKGIMQRILPMFIMPFVLQSAIMPMAIGMLKFMMVKAFLVGKLALSLIMFNAFRNNNSFKGRDGEEASVHYGYHNDGIEEYAAYFNRQVRS